MQTPEPCLGAAEARVSSGQQHARDRNNLLVSIAGSAPAQSGLQLQKYLVGPVAVFTIDTSYENVQTH